MRLETAEKLAPAVGYVFGKFVHSNGVLLRDCSKAPHRKDENILYSRTRIASSWKAISVTWGATNRKYKPGLSSSQLTDSVEHKQNVPKKRPTPYKQSSYSTSP
jgi:hypothetical protein